MLMVVVIGMAATARTGSPCSVCKQILGGGLLGQSVEAHDARQPVGTLHNTGPVVARHSDVGNAGAELRGMDELRLRLVLLARERGFPHKDLARAGDDGTERTAVVSRNTDCLRPAAAGLPAESGAGAALGTIAENPAVPFHCTFIHYYYS